jgi:hypothetical protein
LKNLIKDDNKSDKSDKDNKSVNSSIEKQSNKIEE